MRTNAEIEAGAKVLASGQLHETQADIDRHWAWICRTDPEKADMHRTDFVLACAAADAVAAPAPDDAESTVLKSTVLPGAHVMIPATPEGWKP